MDIAYRSSLRHNVNVKVSLREAIKIAGEPNPYMYEGKLEKIEAENEKILELLTRLLETVYGDNAVAEAGKADQLRYILGDEFTIND